MKIVFIILFQLSLACSQEIPIDYFSSQSIKLLYDAGKNWQSLTIFSPTSLKTYSKKERKIFNGEIGFDTKNSLQSIYGYSYFEYKNLYAYIYPVFLNNSLQVKGLHTNMISSYENHSGVGFKNSWAVMQLGKGNESWGAGNDIQLALSERSGTYDYFLLASDYGRIRVKYIHGFLENVSSNNRYITARGIEWSNQKTLIIGLSEIVIYSGENRSIDFGYINPISSHLEIELNNRLNIIGDSNSNAVWQLHLDYLIRKNVRISFNLLYDEFVFDQDIEIGKEHGRAYAIRLACTPPISKNYLITFYSSLVYVGTPTFRHEVGTNNFVQDERPLGWYGGSDGKEICVGVKYFNYKNMILNISTGILQNGEETLTNNTFETYSDYLKGPFPSGEITNTFYLETSLIYSFRENYTILSSFNLSKDENIFSLGLTIPIFK